ncbi:hypothetical protein J0D14_003047 [Listeria monocytogenes]|nr:hypothetical protein [Listeria monocytogenes]
MEKSEDLRRMLAIKRLEQLNGFDFFKKVSEFRNLNRKKISDEQLFNEMMSLFSVDNNVILMPITVSFKKDNLFYRIRNLGKEYDLNQLKIQDFWSPPDHMVKNYGRINKPKESILYTSLSINGCLEEISLNNDDIFLVMRYKMKREIKGTQIGGDFRKQLNLESSRAEQNYAIINDFINVEFSREVGIGTEYLYKTSELIAKSFFDLPSEWQDAWTFPSIQEKSNMNIAFRKKTAEEILILDSVLVCKYHEDQKGGVLVGRVFNNFEDDQFDIIDSGTEDFINFMNSY